jgi:5-methylcytosine-specific restriction protein B
MEERLSDDRIKALYQRFRESSDHQGWQGWHNSYLEEVANLRKLTDTELRTPENQERLWKARGISGLGPGESVNTDTAYRDSELSEAIVSLRNKQWPEDALKRAKSLQESWDKILGIVHPRHSSHRPQAKLSRLFTALLPEQFHTGYKWDSFRKIAELLLGSGNVPFCESAVLGRNRIREVLGMESDLSEHVYRSMFCWWLYENYDAIKAGNEPAGDASGESGVEDDAESAELLIWPITKQIKGIAAVSGYTDTYRAVIGAARGGATPDDIVQTMRTDLGYDQLAPVSCRAVFNRVRGLGFLENKNGLWYPSEEGERLVEEDPPDVLVEKYLVQSFGLGHLLKYLSESGPMERKAIYESLRALYPNWSTDFMPGALAAWAQSLGLVEAGSNGILNLTEYGEAWADRLPAELPVPLLSKPPDPEIVIDEKADKKPPKEWPDLERVLKGFNQDPLLRSFVLDPEQLEALHLAWHSQTRKRFVILSGLSGTGKTAVLFHYARVFCELMGIDVARHRATIAVSPDWRDPSGLLGYFNALHADPTFQAEPALRLILDAANDPQNPYFLILDEMNLARVERYFAPFLSTMETGEQLVLHANEESVNGVPPKVHWPSNLFIGGTVNMDETTYPFSDKVLDRAFTIEFWRVDLQRYFDRRAESNGGKRHEELEAFLQELNKILKRIRRHFGYRSVGEILDFMDSADSLGQEDEDKYWKFADQAIFSKVLPRLRGEETPALRDALVSARELCKSRDLVQCTAKLEEMKDRLGTTGATRFWS